MPPSSWLCALPFLLALAPSTAEAKPKQPLPVAVEAKFKERIAAKLTSSLDSAVSQLAWALGIGPADDAKGGGNAVFGQGYELDLGAGRWRARCELDVVEGRDSVSHCAIHKLQALTALCEVEGAAEEHKAGVKRLLKQLLGRRETVIPGLGVKRSLLPVGNGIEAWMSETSPGSGDYDVVIPLHAAAMLTVVQCGSALNETDAFSDVQAWFAAIQKAYPQSAWDKQSFHSNAILWESFVMISQMVRPGSSFAEEMEDFLGDFESYLSAQFAQQENAWSFSGANAAVLNWAAAKKPSRRKKFGKAVDEYMKRWKQLAPGLNSAEMYTCGPLQGLAPMLLKRGDQAADLVSSVLALAERNVDIFQLSGLGEGEGPRSAAAERLGDKLGKLGAGLEGAFMRDAKQQKSEKRESIRIDDTAQCVRGLWRTLRLLDDLVGVEVQGEGQGAEGGAQSPSAEAGRTDL